MLKSISANTFNFRLKSDQLQIGLYITPPAYSAVANAKSVKFYVSKN